MLASFGQAWQKKMKGFNMLYELKYKWIWIILGLVLVALITTLSLMPASSLPKLYSNDKFVHFFAYFTVTCWFVGLIRPDFYLLLGIVFFSFSFTIEIMQDKLTRFRQFEWLDLLANSIGIFSAVFLGYVFLKGWCQLVERKYLIK
jgi:VanZ family protein